MKIKIVFITLVLFFISITLVCQPSNDFWTKFKYSIEIVFLRNCAFDDFLRISKKNSGNKLFDNQLWSEILFNCTIDDLGNVSYSLPSEKKLYEKLKSEINLNLIELKKSHVKEQNFVFIKLDKDEPKDIGFVPYLFMLRIPKTIKIPKNVYFSDFYDKNESIKSYLRSVEDRVLKFDSYKFYLDENGIYWLYFKK